MINREVLCKQADVGNDIDSIKQTGDCVVVYCFLLGREKNNETVQMLLKRTMFQLSVKLFFLDVWRSFLGGFVEE